MSEDKIVSGYYQSNITTSRCENSTYTMKYAIDKLQQENKKLKEIIEEVKKYIQENLFKGNNGCGCWWQQFDDYTDAKSELLEILDKVKEVKK